MRCLEALGRWQELDELGEQSLLISTSQHNLALMGENVFSGEDSFRYSSGGSMNTTLSEADTRQKIVQMTARGCWAMGKHFGVLRV